MGEELELKGASGEEMFVRWVDNSWGRGLYVHIVDDDEGAGFELGFQIPAPEMDKLGIDQEGGA